PRPPSPSPPASKAPRSPLYNRPQFPPLDRAGARVPVDEFGRARYKVVKAAVAAKIPWDRNSSSSRWIPPRRLSREAISLIRQLHQGEPEKFSTAVLAAEFRTSPEAIRRILKSRFELPQEEAERRERKRREKLDEERKAKQERGEFGAWAGDKEGESREIERIKGLEEGEQEDSSLRTNSSSSSSTLSSTSSTAPLTMDPVFDSNNPASPLFSPHYQVPVYSLEESLVILRRQHPRSSPKPKDDVSSKRSDLKKFFRTNTDKASKSLDSLPPYQKTTPSPSPASALFDSSNPKSPLYSPNYDVPVHSLERSIEILRANNRGAGSKKAKAKKQETPRSQLAGGIISWSA
ncbi:hypothetical protein P7C70_g7500, partial [Phenoliferia sp. Uapishka_3]